MAEGVCEVCACKCKLDCRERGDVLLGFGHFWPVLLLPGEQRLVFCLIFGAMILGLTFRESAGCAKVFAVFPPLVLEVKV